MTTQLRDQHCFDVFHVGFEHIRQVNPIHDISFMILISF